MKDIRSFVIFAYNYEKTEPKQNNQGTYMSVPLKRHSRKTTRNQRETTSGGC